MWAGDLVSARLLARKGIVDPTDFTSLLAWKLEGKGSSGGGGGGGGGGDTPPADNYTWEGVAYHINNGTYRDVYAIGDTVPLGLGSEGVINMQVDGIDREPLADGSGTAAITFIATELMKTNHAMNDTPSTVGGWESCSLRAYLRDTVTPMIPTNVNSMICSVKIKQYAYKTNSSSSVFVQETADRVFIPGTSYRPYGKGIRKNVGSGTAATYWVRDANSTEYYYMINASGARSQNTANVKYGVCLGFCTGKSK